MKIIKSTLMLTLLVSGSCYASLTTRTVDADTHVKLINYMKFGYIGDFTTKHPGTTVDNLYAAKEQGLTINGVLEMNQEELDQVAKNAEEKDLNIVKASNMIQYKDKEYLTNIEPVVDTFHENYGDDRVWKLLIDYKSNYDEYSPYQALFYNPDRIPSLCGTKNGGTVCGPSFTTLEEDQYADLKAAGETLKEHAHDAKDGLTRKIFYNSSHGQFGKEFKQQGIDIDRYITGLQGFYYDMDDDDREQLKYNSTNSSLSIIDIEDHDDLQDLIKSFQYID
jgi:hypothetical protein